MAESDFDAGAVTRLGEAWIAYGTELAKQVDVVNTAITGAQWTGLGGAAARLVWNTSQHNIRDTVLEAANNAVDVGNAIKEYGQELEKQIEQEKLMELASALGSLFATLLGMALPGLGLILGRLGMVAQMATWVADRIAELLGAMGRLGRVAGFGINMIGGAAGNLALDTIGNALGAAATHTPFHFDAKGEALSLGMGALGGGLYGSKWSRSPGHGGEGSVNPPGTAPGRVPGSSPYRVPDLADSQATLTGSVEGPGKGAEGFGYGWVKDHEEGPGVLPGGGTPTGGTATLGSGGRRGALPEPVSPEPVSPLPSATGGGRATTGPQEVRPVSPGGPGGTAVPPGRSVEGGPGTPGTRPAGTSPALPEGAGGVRAPGGPATAGRPAADGTAPGGLPGRAPSTGAGSPGSPDGPAGRGAGTAGAAAPDVRPTSPVGGRGASNSGAAESPTAPVRPDGTVEPGGSAPSGAGAVLRPGRGGAGLEPSATVPGDAARTSRPGAGQGDGAARRPVPGTGGREASPHSGQEGPAQPGGRIPEETTADASGGGGALRTTTSAEGAGRPAADTRDAAGAAGAGAGGRAARPEPARGGVPVRPAEGGSTLEAPTGSGRGADPSRGGAGKAGGGTVRADAGSSRGLRPALPGGSARGTAVPAGHGPGSVTGTEGPGRAGPSRSAADPEGPGGSHQDPGTGGSGRTPTGTTSASDAGATRPQAVRPAGAAEGPDSRPRAGGAAPDPEAGGAGGRIPGGADRTVPDASVRPERDSASGAHRRGSLSGDASRPDRTPEAAGAGSGGRYGRGGSSGHGGSGTGGHSGSGGKDGYGDPDGREGNQGRDRDGHGGDHGRTPDPRSAPGREEQWRRFRHDRDDEFTGRIAVVEEFSLRVGGPTLDREVAEGHAAFSGDDPFRGAHVPEGGDAFREVRERYHDDLHGAFERLWKEASRDGGDFDTLWTRAHDDLRRTLPDRFARRSTQERAYEGLDRALDRAVRQQLRDGTLGDRLPQGRSGRPADPDPDDPRWSAVEELRADLLREVRTAVDRTWGEGRPAAVLDRDLGEIHAGIPDRLAALADRERDVAQAVGVFDRAAAARHDADADAVVRPELRAGLRAAHDRLRRDLRDSPEGVFASRWEATRRQLAEHADFRARQLRDASRVLRSALDGPDALPGARELTEGNRERLTTAWNRDVLDAADAHWFGHSGDPGVRVPRTPAGRGPAGTPHIPGDLPRETGSRLAGSLPARIEHELGRTDVLAGAARDLHALTRTSGYSVRGRTAGAGDRAFDRLADDFRERTVTRWDEIHDTAGRGRTGAWLRQEAERDDTFRTVLDEEWQHTAIHDERFPEGSGGVLGRGPDDLFGVRARMEKAAEQRWSGGGGRVGEGPVGGERDLFGVDGRMRDRVKSEAAEQRWSGGGGRVGEGPAGGERDLFGVDGRMKDRASAGTARPEVPPTRPAGAGHDRPFTMDDLRPGSRGEGAEGGAPGGSEGGGGLLNRGADGTATVVVVEPSGAAGEPARGGGVSSSAQPGVRSAGAGGSEVPPARTGGLPGGPGRGAGEGGSEGSEPRDTGHPDAGGPSLSDGAVVSEGAPRPDGQVRPSGSEGVRPGLGDASGDPLDGPSADAPAQVATEDRLRTRGRMGTGPGVSGPGVQGEPGGVTGVTSGLGSAPRDPYGVRGRMERGPGVSGPGVQVPPMRRTGAGHDRPFTMDDLRPGSRGEGAEGGAPGGSEGGGGLLNRGADGTATVVVVEPSGAAGEPARGGGVSSSAQPGVRSAGAGGSEVPPARTGGLPGGPGRGAGEGGSEGSEPRDTGHPDAGGPSLSDGAVVSEGAPRPDGQVRPSGSEGVRPGLGDASGDPLDGPSADAPA
ncbi:hypothetical protein LO771_20930, partial [Streptacidiphilus sp. ASG 303]|nr:hypothetical protein [Streptacidiphilus sp. ASG 303]